MAKPESVTISEAIASVDAAGNDNRELTLEQLSLLLMTDRVHDVENRIRKEFSDLKKRQDKVSTLHQFMKLINKLTNDKSEINIADNDEVKTLMKEMKDLGVNIDETKTSYNKDERDRLLDNVKMTIDDLNVQNDLQMQTISRLTNERYETFQMIRTIMKPLHEDKLNKARAISGR
jgi:hypothetical protein